MKQFILLIRESLGNDVTERSPQELHEAFLAWIQQFDGNQSYKTGSRLKTHQTLIHANGDIASDGPFVEPKEMIGGIVIFNSSDFDSALSLIKKSPFYRYHDLELREVQQVYDG